VRGTAGIKDAGSQGPNRLLLADNNGPNAFVGNNQSTLIHFVPPSSDFYSFHLDAGQSATLALKGLSGSGAHMELEDASGTPLAEGVAGSSNADEVISDFLAPASGTYYARIIGNGSPANYSLVVTVNADFAT
jgi:hypothetical protein